MNALLIVLALAAMAHAAPQFSSFSPIAIPTVLPDGHLADTPEVAAAKRFHFAEIAKAAAASRSSSQFSDAPEFSPSFSPAPSPSFSPAFSPSFSPAPTNQYQSLSNPTAGVEVYPNGFIADTADVAKAKAIHYAALAQAQGASVEPYVRYLANFP